jgi:hypothetical protein
MDFPSQPIPLLGVEIEPFHVTLIVNPYEDGAVVGIRKCRYRPEQFSINAADFVSSSDSASPELGSTFFSANWAPNQAWRASITG